MSSGVWGKTAEEIWNWNRKWKTLKIDIDLDMDRRTANFEVEQPIYNIILIFYVILIMYNFCIVICAPNTNSNTNTR